MITYLLYAIIILLILLGLVGCILPAIPGPPLCYIALLVAHFSNITTFSYTFLGIWLLVVIAVQVLDFIIPSWGTKKFGGSKLGAWGSFFGTIIGTLFFAPLGILLGPFIGAIIGELLSQKDLSTAIKAGFGSFVGFFFSTILKFIVCGAMVYYLVS